MSTFVTVQAIRTDCRTGRMSITSVKICLVRPMAGALKGDLWLEIVSGGVTGFESIQYTKKHEERIRELGWWACAGTEDKYNSLFVPALEMIKVFDELNCKELENG